MVVVNYREIEERFSHLDAEFVSAQLSLPERTARYSVRLYPWWEHPRITESIARGNSWKVVSGEEGKRLVTVFAHNVYEARLSQSAGDVIEWAFLDEHPLLWVYHPSHQILCTTALTASQTEAIIDLVRAETRREVDPYSYLNVPQDTRTFYEWTASTSFVLGYFPTPLYRKVIAHLDAIGVQYLGTGQVADTPSVPILLLIDGDDYIIAGDFTVDLPEFVHNPDWVTES